MLKRALTAALIAIATGCSRTEPVPPAKAPASTIVTRPTAAPVVVVEFFDYGCHYCAEFERTVVPVIEREFVAAGKVEWRAIPFATGSTPHSLDAASALECARQQQAASAMSRMLFDRRGAWIHGGDPEWRFTTFAGELGLDRARFRSCYRGATTAESVGRLRRLARDLQVRTAPTFLVNGRRVEGALDLESFRAVVKAAMPPDLGS